jgi:DNA-directed RNA polymerase subunit M/transcription elongation factor TFIIS
MLVFCEECGCKNLLADEEPDQKTVRFRCTSCDYENIWQPPQQKVEREKVDESGTNQSSGE